MPGAITTRPSGLRRSLAIFAMSFEVPTPTEPVSPPVTSCTRSLSRSATAVTVATEWSGSSAAARSTNASSRDSGSTRGDSSRSSAMTASLVRRYTWCRPLRYAACGQRDRASRVDIADRTPKTRASYDAVATTPRPPTPPTTTGLPRSDGLSRCSTAAKNASRSTWRIVGSVRTGPS